MEIMRNEKRVSRFDSAGEGRYTNAPKLGGEKEKMNRRRSGIITVGIATTATIAIAILALAAFSTPAMAQDPCICGSPYNYHPCPCRCSVSDTVNGTVLVEGGETPDSGQSYTENHVTMDFYLNATGTVKWARLYNHVWGGSQPRYGGANMTFCNATGQCWDHPTGIYCPPMEAAHGYPNNCEQTMDEGFYQCGYGTHWLYWNVTPYVTTGYNNATIHTNDYGSTTWDGRVMLMVLVVVFEDQNQPEIRYWVDQGLSKPEYPDIPEALFSGFINQSANHTLWQAMMRSDDPISIDFNGCELEHFLSGIGDDLTKHNVPASCINSPGNNKMKWDQESGSIFPALAVLAEHAPQFFPDLKVVNKTIDHLNGSCYCQTPTEFVEDHVYDVKAKILNDGDLPTGSSFSVTLYDNDIEVQTNTMGALDEGESEWTTFQWTPTTSGPHPLSVLVDSGNAVNEGPKEGNNYWNQTETVLSETGLPDLIPAMDFSPAWQCNKTDIVVTVLNDGQVDISSNFDVTVTMQKNGAPLWTGTQSTSVCAKAKKELIFVPPYDLERCSDYAVTVELDSGYTVGESDEGNNIESKTFHAIELELKVTHHFGNWSDYTGQLSGYNTVKMFETNKVVTNYTTPIKLLTSEADAIPGPGHEPPYVWGINRTVNKGTSTWYMNQSNDETETCIPGEGLWWYNFVNGIGFSTIDLMDDYYFEDGEKMQMDIQKCVNAGDITTHFRPRSIMGYPEPFKHGFNGDVWATTIVYPSTDPDGDYAALASAIQSSLSSAGVTTVNVKTTASVTTTEKQNNHLILLGTQSNNNIIDELNDHHTEVGMPVYFNGTNWMVDDWLNDCQDATFDCGGVVEACDNPYNNAEPWDDTWDDESQTIWIASGVGDKEAKNAAELLANHNDRFNKKFFWGYTINITIYEDLNLISTPFELDEETGTDTLDWVFEDNPANWDKVRRFISGGYKTAYYYNGVWYGQVTDVEPIEPEVGYEYQREGTGDFNLILGCRLPPGTISTPIYEDLNLIGYACLAKTDLHTFDEPANWDKVRRFVSGGYKTAYYYNGVWYGQVADVEPIEPGVGYEYQREGTGSFDWIYSC
jgi:hypothetical protein